MEDFNLTYSIKNSTSSMITFHRLFKSFGIIYIALVIIFGFIGNFISSYVFIRSKLK